MTFGWTQTARRALSVLLAAVGLLVGGWAAAQESAEPDRRQRPAAMPLAGDERNALVSALEQARRDREEAAMRLAALEQWQRLQHARSEALGARQREQEQALSAVLATLARHSGELRDQLAGSWITVGGAALPPRLDQVEVLSAEHVTALADALAALTAETGRVVAFEALVAGDDGRIAPREVVRLGDMTAFSDGQFLVRGSEEDVLATAARTPAAIEERLADFQAEAGERVALDPTRGEVIEALAQQPDLAERFRQGGVVGYVVVGLGVLGLLAALLQYGYLLKVGLAMRRQRRDLEALRGDNPLGRVLSRFRTLTDGVAPEALEARLDEALLAELPRLERGQGLLKLLAAVAPLLGLLGTVTGMIVTFQAITVYGTGDPQLMAGGISQALVTTVLGLVTAVPLLFAHTALVARSRELVDALEGQASAALAARLAPSMSAGAPGGERRDATLA